jgi:ribosomal protein S18 acetylase RimI-like enzyme
VIVTFFYEKITKKDELFVIVQAQERKIDMQKLTFNQKIDEIAKKWDTSGLVMVYQNGVFTHEKVYGYADRIHQIPMTTKHTYLLSSRSRLFVGLAVAALVEQGRIVLEETLDRFIPEYRFATKITLQQVLSHSSGISDFFYSHDMIGLQQSKHHQALTEEERFRIERTFCERSLSFQEVFEIVKDKPLDFEPGARDTDWSLTNVLFMQEAVERISGMNFISFLEKYVFALMKVQPLQKSTHTSTVSYGCIKETQLVRLPVTSEVDHVLEFSVDDIKKLMIALVEQSIFMKKTWRKALEFNKEGYSILSENANGIHCAEAGFMGFEMNLYFDKPNKLAYVHMTNEIQTLKRINNEWFYFRKDFRRVIEEATTYPKNTRLVRYKEANAWDAMELKVDKDQESFVFDAKSSLAYTLIKPRVRRAYVLMEGERSVGLVVLSIDRKKSYYNIDVVLIDQKYQKRGYGKIMLKKSLDILKKNGAKKIEIGVSRFNIAAQKLYLSLGFEKAAVYEQGMALKMEL